MGQQSASLIEAIDRLREELGTPRGPEFPALAEGPHEVVLAFTGHEQIFLRGVPDDPHFASHGQLVDFRRREHTGLTSILCFPIKDLDPQAGLRFPNPQPSPFDEPPVDPTNTRENGFSKQAYFLGGGDSLVTVGPSLPRIAPLKGGGAQFWVGSTGVISQGTGKYLGARGISAYNGSSYFDRWPESWDEQVKLLQQGFPALVSAYFKLVLASALDLRAEPRLDLGPGPSRAPRPYAQGRANSNRRPRRPRASSDRQSAADVRRQR